MQRDFQGLAGGNSDSRRFDTASLRWKLIIPIPAALIVAVVAAAFLVPRVIANNAIEVAVSNSEQIAHQFKTIRGYYTNSVVSKAVKDNKLKASFDHKTTDGAIPLPATFVQDLSELLADRDTTVSLYSVYPFPNRKDRKLDDFQQQAWKFLVANPKETFVRNETLNGRPVVRVAVADVMSGQGCVTCHNTMATSPKTGWKLGDVRGVLEVTSAIDRQLAQSRNVGWLIVAGIILTGLVLVAVSFAVAKSVTNPISGITGAVARMMKGDYTAPVPGTERKDEIGALAKAVVVFRDDATEAARLKSESERRVAAEREATTAKVMDEFDGAVSGIVQAATAGDFSCRVPLDGKEGALRSVSASMNAMCENVGEVFDDLEQVLAALAQGDLTSRVAAEYQGAFARLKDNANAMAQRLSETMAEINAAAAEVANAASEISAATTDLSQRTEQQAASLEQTTASMEEISATVKKNAENAQQASRSASATCEVAGSGGEVVGQAVAAMSRIEESSRKIADIIGVIDEIARQTNLLALNAAVEAARAGDAGRGFAVVASEVRSLAQRSSQAAKDITSLIGSSTSQVKEGVELVNRAGEQLKGIVQSIQGVAGIVSEIAAASAEQSTGIDQVNKALAQMDQVTQQNSALVEQNAATSKTLEQQAAHMKERVSYFRLDAERGNAAAAAHVPVQTARRPTASRRAVA
jgi:methyl-accepting chemotaxis protein